MAKVIMTADEYIRRLEIIANENTFYCNTYPFNICMVCPPKSVKNFKDHNGNVQVNRNKTDSIAISADCWNLIKALLNGYDVNNHTIGYAQFNLNNTGDVGVKELMEKCTDVSADFSKLKDGEPRLLQMPKHAGTFIGERVIDGKVYNVIESTGSWERKVLYSYVDETGARRHYKGAAKNGQWEKHGKMTAWLDYSKTSGDAAVQPTEPVQRNLDAVALLVYNGKYGNEPERSKKLKAEGYSTSEIKTIQKKVNELCKAKTTTPKETVITYTVKQGDNLTAIARRYGTTVLAIVHLNPQIKNPNKIYIGQKIRVK